MDRSAEARFAATLRRLFATATRYDTPVIVIATAHSTDEVSKELRACFLHEAVVSSPDEGERGDILAQLLSNSAIGRDVSIEDIASKTAGRVGRDMMNLVGMAGAASFARIRNDLTDLTDLAAAVDIDNPAIFQAGFGIRAQDFDSALNFMSSHHAASIGAPKVPNVSWKDIGGLGHVKEEILDTVQLPLKHPQLFSSGLRQRSGVLLFGPPGTGKTLIAKAVATECSLSFLSVKGPELINMYVGESEKNVREVFQRARDARPCVIFFDELDSLAPNRGRGADSGGVMDRIVSQLLAELDGMQKMADVFVIGATNRPDLIDPALLRPGRFDRLLYLGVSQDHDAQCKIIEALTRKYRTTPDLNIRKIVEQCPFNFTGADFYAMCSDALLNAIKRRVAVLDEKIDKETHRSAAAVAEYLSTLPESDLSIEVSEEDFVKAMNTLNPSVSVKELAHYDELRKKLAPAMGK